METPEIVTGFLIILAVFIGKAVVFLRTKTKLCPSSVLFQYFQLMAEICEIKYAKESLGWKMCHHYSGGLS